MRFNHEALVGRKTSSISFSSHHDVTSSFRCGLKLSRMTYSFPLYRDLMYFKTWSNSFHLFRFLICPYSLFEVRSKNAIRCRTPLSLVYVAGTRSGLSAQFSPNWGLISRGPNSSRQSTLPSLGGLRYSSTILFF
jgi:hypothetical protein